MNSLSLRTILWLDAVVAGLTGLLLVTASSLLSRWLGLPAALLLGVGLSFVLYAGFLAWVIRSVCQRPPVIQGIAAYNLLWAMASVVMLLLGIWPLTLLGKAFVLLQAVIIGTCGGQQLSGLKATPHA